ncbi:MAG: winged helix-turn-helix domain-containing protein [Candidatus Aenigmatarchaeota archaeon]
MDHVKFFGSLAGKVWHALKGKGPMTLTQLQNHTGLTIKETGMGLGWLAKENKIKVSNAGSVHAKYELCE